MNDQVIIAVANAITAQAETLKALIDALPRETRDAVAEKVKDTAKPAAVEVPVEKPSVQAVPVAPITQAIAPVPPVQAVPVAIQQPIQVVTEPVVAQQVQAAPAIQQPIQQPIQQTASCPINDHKSLLTYTMNRYKELGPIKGAEIQGILTGLGYTNINDVKPEHYAAYHSGCEAIK